MPTGAELEPADGDELAFPASLSQEAFYYVERLCRGEAAPFNVAVRFHLAGPLDAGRLEDALNAVVGRHESLRTQFEETDGLLKQVVLPAAKISLEVTDLGGEPAERRAAEAARLGRIEAQKSFDLGRAPLLRAGLVRISETEHILHVTVHHTVCDGWSVGILVEELAAFYEARGAMAPLAVQYPDFAIWQREFLAGPEVGRQWEYWKKQLAGAAEPEFPADRPRPPVKLWNGDIVSEVLPAELTSRLRTIAQENGASLFQVFAAAFAILLRRYTGSTDIIFGTPVAGRNRAELEPVIGTFINSLVLRIDLSGDPDFREALRRVRRVAIEALENQDIPFESLVRELRPQRDPARNPIFQINFTHQRDFVRPVKFGGVQLTPIPSLPSGAIFDLNVFMVEREDGWRMSCDYCTDLFERGTAVRLLAHLRVLLEGIANDATLPISRYGLFAGEDLESWSGRRTEYPREGTLGGLFEETAARFADRPALAMGERTATYRQLLAYAVRLARTLQEHGVGPGIFVPVAAGPGFERIGALVAIVLAGGAYVPVDPSDPAERLSRLFEETKAGVILADERLAERLPVGGRRMIPLGRWDGSETMAEFHQGNGGSADAAYVLYTSGSTGIPKGVVVPQRAVIRLVRGNDFVDISADDVFLQAAPLSFDASTLEIWAPLLNGGKLVLPETEKPSLAELAGLIGRHGVTTLWLTAGLFEMMIEEHAAELRTLRNLLSGGDVLPVPAVRRALEALPETRLINGYGPTENTTFTTCHTITKGDLERRSIPIGRPIANTTVWILDEAGRPVPAGVPGEIHAGGDGLASGYLNDEALTRERFVPSPLPGREGEILYRTGDLGRWGEDGNIEFLGRKDRQVKVRGFRIEPGEVESAILQHPGVGQCRVDVRGGTSGEKSLVAWVSGAGGTKPDVLEIRRSLEQKLPAYARPDAIAVLDQFPLTASGKIDVRALPAPQAVTAPAVEEPQTDTEKQLAAIWRELLGLASVGRNDNFFALGGHSLLGLRLFSRIRSAFGRTLPLSALLQAPTLRRLAELVDGASSGEKDTIVVVEPGAPKKPFWCIHGGDGRAMIYRKLAPHLDRDRPLLGLESPVLFRSDEVKVGTVEDIAAEYLAMLRRRQPEGPYYLGGYSFGGVAAYEMARRLESQGEKVALLVIFDTMNPQLVQKLSLPRQMGSLWRMHSHSGVVSRVRGLFQRAANFWKAQEAANLPVRLGNLARRTAGFLRERFRNKAGVFAPRPGEADSGVRDAQLIRAYRWAVRGYHPGAYAGRILLLKTPERIHGADIPRDYGWADVAADLEIIDVPGEHMTLFDPGNVEVLAEPLRARLRSADD